MKELTPLVRGFELESYEEHARFSNLLDEQGYVVSKKYGRNSRTYSIKKQDADETEGSLNCFLGEHTLRIIRGTELEKLADDFMTLNLTKDSADARAKMERFEHDADVRDIAGVDE